jgi:hypothetical protein
MPACHADASLSTVKLPLTFSEVLTNSTPVEGSDSEKFPKPRHTVAAAEFVLWA